MLVPPNDAQALARALVNVLSSRERAASLGFVAREGSEQWYATPEEYAARIRALVVDSEDSGG